MLCSFTHYFDIAGGPIPYDGIQIQETVTVPSSLTVVYSLLATGGIILGVVCLVFNFIFRGRKWVATYINPHYK